jgi:hypothetical protein
MMMMSASEMIERDVTETIVSVRTPIVNPDAARTGREPGFRQDVIESTVTLREVRRPSPVGSHVHNLVDARWTTEKVLGMTRFLGG